MRNKRGSVHIHARNGLLQLRWTYQGKDKYLSLGMPDTPLNRAIAKRKAGDIEQDLYGGGKPEGDLIFATVTGKAIDDHNFSQRTWKDICTAAGIPYRVPYAARHSLGSHLLESGATIPQVAEVLGNNPETTARHYAHAINRPKMPGF